MVAPLWVTTMDVRSAYWQFSAKHMVKSLTLNPYMSLFNLKLCTHIWSTNINFRPPPYIGFFGPSWSELSPCGWIWGGGGGRLGLRHFCHGQKRDYLSCACYMYVGLCGLCRPHNNVRCTQATKTTHSLDGQHQDVDMTQHKRGNHRMTEDRDNLRKYVHGVANPRTEDGWRTEQNRTIMWKNIIMQSIISQ